MPEEWLELAHINFHKTILHGHVTAGYDQSHVRQEREIEQVLTAEQKQQWQSLSERQHAEMQKLLRTFVAD